MYQNDTLVQTLVIKKYNKKDILFILTSKNKLQNKTKSIKGTAKLKDGNVEIDEDLDGNAYPVYEYVYSNSDCWLSIRLDLDTKSKLSTNSADCSSEDSYCPFSSVGTLKKEQLK